MSQFTQAINVGQMVAKALGYDSGAGISNIEISFPVEGVVEARVTRYVSLDPIKQVVDVLKGCAVVKVLEEPLQDLDVTENRDA